MSSPRYCNGSLVRSGVVGRKARHAVSRRLGRRASFSTAAYFFLCHTMAVYETPDSPEGLRPSTPPRLRLALWWGKGASRGKRGQREWNRVIPPRAARRRRREAHRLGNPLPRLRARPCQLNLL
eukprot:818342-Alexandrium_andersonii.AAC.1